MPHFRLRLGVAFGVVLAMVIAGPSVLVWQSPDISMFRLGIIGLCLGIALYALLAMYRIVSQMLGAFAVFAAAQQAAQHDDFVQVETTLLPAELQQFAASYNEMVGTIVERRKTLHEQLRRTALLMRLAIELRETFEANDVIHDTLKVITTNTDACGASMMLLAADGSIEAAFEIERNQLEQIKPQRARAIIERGLAGWVMRQRHGVILNDAANDERWQPFEGSPQARSVIALPLAYGKTIHGVLTITHARKGQFTSSDLLVLESVAAQAGLALSAALRNAEERSSREQALMLFRMSQDMTDKRSARELADALLEQANAAFGLVGGYLFLGDTDGTHLVWFASRYQDSCILPDSTSVQAQLAKHAWHSRETMIEALKPDAADGTGLAYVAMPLIHHGAAVGVFVAVRRAHGTAIFPARTWSTLSIYTNVAAAAFTNLNLISELEQHSEQLQALSERRTLANEYNR